MTSGLVKDILNTPAIAEKRQPRFLLYGVGGAYNYGCEAIVRGTERILRHRWPNAEIRYASYRPEDDRKRLADTGIGVIPCIQYPRYSLPNLVRKLALTSGVNTEGILKKQYLPILEDCDIVLSIGGDMYTVDRRGGYDRRLIGFGEIAKSLGKKLVVWGASIGPFDSGSTVENIIAKHLSKADLITCREQRCRDYLESIGLSSNVLECADPAFVVDLDAQAPGSSDGSLRIGVNLSPLSTCYSLTGSDTEHSVTAYSHLVSKIARDTCAEILLLPHVVSDLEVDNDLTFLARIAESVDRDVAERVRIVCNDPGFLGIKKEILSCNIVVAARMHCAVNAISTGTPALFLSYSSKSVGMANYVYGNSEWVTSVSDFVSGSGDSLLVSMLNRERELRDYLKRRLPVIRSHALAGLDRLGQLIDRVTEGNPDTILRQ